MILLLKDLLKKENLTPYVSPLSQFLGTEVAMTDKALPLAVEGLVSKFVLAFSTPNSQSESLFAAIKEKDAVQIEPEAPAESWKEWVSLGRKNADQLFSHYEWEEFRSAITDHCNMQDEEASQTIYFSTFLVMNSLSAQFKDFTFPSENVAGIFDDAKVVLQGITSPVSRLFSKEPSESVFHRFPLSGAAKKILQSEPKKEWMKILPYLVIGLFSALALYALRHSEWGIRMHSKVLEADASDTSKPHLHIFEQDVQTLQISPSNSLTVPKESYLIELVNDLRSGRIRPEKEYIAEEILFDFSKPNLLGYSDQPIANLAVVLKEFSSYQIRITGHCTEADSETEDKVLSEQRALSVKGALIDEGVEPSRIVTIGCGGEYMKTDSLRSKIDNLTSIIELNFWPQQ